MFYTYLHRRNDTGEVFYIGKGQGRRAYNAGAARRNTHWLAVVRKYGHTVEIVALWPAEQEALDHEVFLIDTFRKLGHPLVNITDGGEGASGAKRTRDVRMRMSQAQKDSWASDPSRRARMIATHSSQDVVTRCSQAAKRLWAERREEIVASQRIAKNKPEAKATASRHSKRRWEQDDALRSAVSSANKKLWADQDWRAAMLGSQHAAQSTPEVLSRKSAVGKRLWEDQSTRDQILSTRKKNGKDGSKAVECVDTGEQYRSVTEAAAAYGVSIGAMSMACNGVTKRCSGLTFRLLSTACVTSSEAPETGRCAPLS